MFRAGLANVYNQTCANTGPTGLCVSISFFLLAHFLAYLVSLRTTKYNDNVVGNGSNYADAYFEISHLRAYTTSSAGPTIALDSSPTPSGNPIASSTEGAGGGRSSGGLPQAEVEWYALSWIALSFCAMVGVLVAL